MKAREYLTTKKLWGKNKDQVWSCGKPVECYNREADRQGGRPVYEQKSLRAAHLEAGVIALEKLVASGWVPREWTTPGFVPPKVRKADK